MNTEDRTVLVSEIISFLKNNYMWQDICIYAITSDGNGKEFVRYSSDLTSQNEVKVEYGLDPADYFEFANPDTISMSFEGPFCGVMAYGTDEKLRKRFADILDDYGLYYELGDPWNLTCYDD